MPAAKRPALRRRLNLPLLILYGVGVTVGAGIYVLIGTVANHAGIHAPIAFVLAAIVMGLTVLSYAEMCTRFPVAAGEAAYVRAAFDRRALSRFTGGMMIASAIVASSTVALGASGYIAQFVDWPRPVTLALVVIVLGLVSVWGVLESVLLASLFTLIEVGGLVAVAVAAAYAGVPVSQSLLAIPPLSATLWIGIGFAGLLAFFAFIGFEDLTNMAEEIPNPERNVPIAMIATLIATTMLYVLIAAISVTAVPLSELSASEAPLALVFQKLVGFNSFTISAIAIVSTLNTIIAMMTMATRVVYGMARQGDVPSVFGRVHGTTGTPVIATVAVVVTVLVLAWSIRLEWLAEFTSLSSLIVFALVNLALLKLRLSGRDMRRRRGQIRVPLLFPVLGLVSCLAMILSAILQRLG
jgi:amino acid transporter